MVTIVTEIKGAEFQRGRSFGVVAGREEAIKSLCERICVGEKISIYKVPYIHGFRHPLGGIGM